MEMSRSDQMRELLATLDCDNPDDRVMAIQILGEIGDDSALKVLRERLALVNKELYALVVAVGRMKKRLGVK